VSFNPNTVSPASPLTAALTPAVIPSSMALSASSLSPSDVPTLRLAAIGDVHDQWEAIDNQILQKLGVDGALFVGDFGNESLKTVQQIAQVPCPAAAIYGNHDAWFTATPWGRNKCPYDRQTDNWFEQQRVLLQELEIGYRYRDFPAWNLSIVGGRPFSWGGSEWKYQKFYYNYYGVTDWATSIAKQVDAIQQAQYQTLIFLGHNGPVGLGAEPEDPCGKDWNPLGGDYGDPDFAAAIDQAIALGKHVPLVVFGHMHHNLRHRRDQLRRMIHQNQHGTIFFNAARVPRIVEHNGVTMRNFSLIELQAQQVTRIDLVWVDREGVIQAQEAIYNREVYSEASCSL